MGRIGKKKQGDIEPDLTSFSDIANLLIIFFILTTSLVRPMGRQIDMPSSAKPPEQQQQSNTPTVRLTADRILMSEGDKNEKEVTMNELRADLWKRNFPKLSEKNRAVVVETAPEVTYERYYQVATAIAAAGGVVAIMSEQ
jgi:biopolymer transport protein ExbD